MAALHAAERRKWLLEKRTEAAILEGLDKAFILFMFRSVFATWDRWRCPLYHPRIGPEVVTPPRCIPMPNTTSSADAGVEHPLLIPEMLHMEEDTVF